MLGLAFGYHNRLIVLRKYIYLLLVVTSTWPLELYLKMPPLVHHWEAHFLHQNPKFILKNLVDWFGLFQTDLGFQFAIKTPPFGLHVLSQFWMNRDLIKKASALPTFSHESFFRSKIWLKHRPNFLIISHQHPNFINY